MSERNCVDMVQCVLTSPFTPFFLHSREIGFEFDMFFDGQEIARLTGNRTFFFASG